MKSPNLDEKMYEYDWKVFFGQKMDECRKTMPHQILSDCHLNTFLENEKKGLLFTTPKRLMSTMTSPTF